MSIDAVIVAAGSSTRFSEGDKLLADLCGVPVLARSIAAYEAAPSIASITVVASPSVEGSVENWATLHRWTKLAATVPGGDRRRDSVEAGLRRCSTRLVAIHDGARPLVTPDLIERVVAAAGSGPGAIAAIPVTDTLKEVRDSLIFGHPDRASLWAAQTPQVVLRQAWLDAAAMSDNDETDDAAVLSRLGLECTIVEGSPDNMKITRPLDLRVAAAILDSRRD